MTNRRLIPMTIAASLALVLAVGCSEHSKRLNAPPQGDSAYPSTVQRNFIYMADKAMLYDASVADIHFEPHSAELSGLGVRRLHRMAELLDRTGGTINYETSSTDEEMVNARLESVREFLVSSGYDAQKIMVAAGPSQGRAMNGQLAVDGMKRAQEASATAGAASAAPISATP